jgi:isochorismate pyruvate lyase
MVPAAQNRLKGRMIKTTLTVDERLVPADCQTMLDVRQGVDALDRALVQLLTERQGYMDAAARDSGLSEAIAEPVWRTLVDRCIAYEYDSWDRTKG